MVYNLWSNTVCLKKCGFFFLISVASLSKKVFKILYGSSKVILLFMVMS